MTIKLRARPLVKPWEESSDWTDFLLDGDDEETIANVVTASLLMTGHEVELDEDADTLEPEDADAS